MAKIKQTTIEDPELGEVSLESEEVQQEAIAELEATMDAVNPKAKAEVQTFKDLLAQHEETKRLLGMTGVAEFNRAIDAGDKSKARAAINMLAKSNPVRQSMERLLEYI